MTKRNERQFPDWAEQERAGDLPWIHENLHIFWPAAQIGYSSVGRGAIVVDITLRPTGGGHPFSYFDQAAIERRLDEDTQRLVREYDPSWELVTTLLKSQDRVSSYRVGVILTKTRDNLDSRVATSDEVETSQQGEPPVMSAVEPPDIETIMAWESEGFCEATDGCVVEADGTCPHGHRSWLLELGLI